MNRAQVRDLNKLRQDAARLEKVFNLECVGQFVRDLGDLVSLQLDLMNLYSSP